MPTTFFFYCKAIDRKRLGLIFSRTIQLKIARDSLIFLKTVRSTESEKVGSDIANRIK
jgi:hypothetical protein